MVLGDYAGLVGFPTGFGAFFPMAPPVAERGPSDAFFARIELAQAGPAKVTGSGEVPAEDGDGTATFDLAVHSDGDGGLKAHLVLHDPASDVRMRLRRWTACCSGCHPTGSGAPSRGTPR